MTEGRSVMGRRSCFWIVVVLALCGSVPHAVASTRLSAPVTGRAVLGFGATYESGGRCLTHRGVDLEGSAGEAVRAACDGVVAFAGEVPADGGGRTRAVTIRSAEGLLVCVSPLSVTQVSTGARVSAGDVLGELAGTGDESWGTTHVHLSVRDGGTYVEPVLTSAEATKDAPDIPEAPAPVASGSGSGGAAAAVAVPSVNGSIPNLSDGTAAHPVCTAAAQKVSASRAVVDGAKIRTAYAQSIGVMRSSGRGRQVRLVGEPDLADLLERPSLRLAGGSDASGSVGMLVGLAGAVALVAARGRITYAAKRVVGRAG